MGGAFQENSVSFEAKALRHVKFASMFGITFTFSTTHTGIRIDAEFVQWQIKETAVARKGDRIPTACWGVGRLWGGPGWG